MAPPGLKLLDPGRGCAVDWTGIWGTSRRGIQPVKSLNSESPRMKKINRTLKIILVVGLMGLMSSIAWGKPGQNASNNGNGGRGFRSQPDRTGPPPRRCFGGGCNKRRAHAQSDRPVSYVPEPTAARLYAVGGADGRSDDSHQARPATLGDRCHEFIRRND